MIDSANINILDQTDHNINSIKFRMNNLLKLKKHINSTKRVQSYVLKNNNLTASFSSSYRQVLKYKS